MAFKCVMCERTWAEYEHSRVVAHNFDDHNVNLQWISREEVLTMVKEIPI